MLADIKIPPNLIIGFLFKLRFCLRSSPQAPTFDQMSSLDVEQVEEQIKRQQRATFSWFESERGQKDSERERNWEPQHYMLVAFKLYQPMVLPLRDSYRPRQV